jgi:hypothetical protein
MTMPPIAYQQLRDGDALELRPKGEILRFACCDCGLVHKMAFAIEKNGNIGISWRRNIAATTNRRKQMKNKIRKILTEILS